MLSASTKVQSFAVTAKRIDSFLRLCVKEFGTAGAFWPHGMPVYNNCAYHRLCTLCNKALHFGRAVWHIIVHVTLSVHQGDGLFCQIAVRGVASRLRCTVSVVAHAFLRLGCFSAFSLWFRTLSDNVYQFVNATFHNGIGIAQHFVKHSFHDCHTIWFSTKVKCCKGNTKALFPSKKVYNLYTNICPLAVCLHVKECVCFYCHLTLFVRNKLIFRGFKSVR